MEKYIDVMVERARMVREWEIYVERIAKAAKELMPDAEIYVFGSVVKGEATGGSDVDILIKSNNLPKSNLERAGIKVRIEEMAGLPTYHPFEIHLADDEEMEWYSRIKELKRIHS
jgi:predicted nucleotidyltransferase